MELNTLIKDIRSMISGLTIKYSKKAKACETVESLKKSDLYLGAVDETDSYYTYPGFDEQAIVNAEIPPWYKLEDMLANKRNIPEKYRDRVVKEQRKLIVDNYVEENNYYRMLAGLPNIEMEEKDFIYLPEAMEIRYGVPHGTPIHLINADILYSLDNEGILAEIKEAYPDHKYLDFIGRKAINPVNSRRATNFSILTLGKNVPDDFYSTFVKIYDQNREYFTSVLYNPSYSEAYDLYDNFMGLCIMVMTIQRIVSNTFKYGISRNFYDWSFIQAMYKMYNIPFIEDLSMEYHIIILKNLNNLLRYKSTDKVLFDICSLLGQERTRIFRYYLMKKQKLDNNEQPIFYYKEVINDDGTTSLVEDKEKMYELYFQSVNIRERNIALALLDANNKKDYAETVAEDPYWWVDANLNKKIYESEYNYVESKYLSLNMMYKMTEMLFEITYVFRMLIDKKDEIVNYTIALPKIYADKEFKLFDIVMLIVCLMCKRQGFHTYTITTASKISHIYGFNFDEKDIEFVKSIIRDNANILKDDKLINYVNNLQINSAEDCNRLFEQIREFNDYIIEKMAKSQNIEQYRTYRKIFDILMAVDTQTEMYKILDPETGEEKIAESYLEYLNFSDPILGEYVETVEVEKIPEAIEHITAKLNEFMVDLKYLYILNDTNSPIIKSLAALINFFKSYTTDLTSMNIIYIFDSRIYNMIKIIEDVHHISKTLELHDFYKKNFYNWVHIHGRIDPIKDYILTHDLVDTIIITLYCNDYEFFMWDKIGRIFKTLLIKGYKEMPVQYADGIKKFFSRIGLSEHLKIEEVIDSITARYKFIDGFDLEDELVSLSAVFNYIKENFSMIYDDVIKYLSTSMLYNMKITYKDTYKPSVIINYLMSHFHIFDEVDHLEVYIDELQEVVNMLYGDSIKYMLTHFVIKEPMKFRKEYDVKEMIDLIDMLDLEEDVRYSVTIDNNVDLTLNYNDIVKLASLNISHKERMNVIEDWALQFRLSFDEKKRIYDRVEEYHILIDRIDEDISTSYFDVAHAISTHYVENVLNIRDIPSIQPTVVGKDIGTKINDSIGVDHKIIQPTESKLMGTYIDTYKFDESEAIVKDKFPKMREHIMIYRS